MYWSCAFGMLFNTRGKGICLTSIYSKFGIWMHMVFTRSSTHTHGHNPTISTSAFLGGSTASIRTRRLQLRLASQRPRCSLRPEGCSQRSGRYGQNQKTSWSIHKINRDDQFGICNCHVCLPKSIVLKEKPFPRQQSAPPWWNWSRWF